MDIKSFLYKKKEKKAENIWLIVTAIIVILFFIGIIALNKSETKQIVDHFIWEKISTFWVISYDNNYPKNTHKLENSDESFWLKDSTINLNNFSDINVLIDWNINEITEKYPILTISTLRIPSYKLIITDNKYFYTKDLISFDFSKDIDVYSKKVWNQIIVYYKDDPILYVDTFVCSNVTEIQNCNKMKTNYIKNLGETFESALWNIFYRYKEDSWITFNDDNIWYIFKANSDNDLLNLSHLINIVDSRFLLVNKKDFLVSWCSNDEIKIKNISEIKKSILDDNLIKVTISWTDEHKNKVSCKLNIDIFDGRNIANSSISFSE